MCVGTMTKQAVLRSPADALDRVENVRDAVELLRGVADIQRASRIFAAGVAENLLRFVSCEARRHDLRKCLHVIVDEAEGAATPGELEAARTKVIDVVDGLARGRATVFRRGHLPGRQHRLLEVVATAVCEAARPAIAEPSLYGYASAVVVMNNVEAANTILSVRERVDLEHDNRLLFRYVIGNPFRPTPVHVDSDCVAMAKALVGCGIDPLAAVALADKQEEHGCAEAADVLRSRPYVRGCHVVRAILAA